MIHQSIYRPLHEWHLQADYCVWCGMTREQVEEFGEVTCPRRLHVPREENDAE